MSVGSLAILGVILVLVGVFLSLPQDASSGSAPSRLIVAVPLILIALLLVGRA